MIAMVASTRDLLRWLLLVQSVGWGKRGLVHRDHSQRKMGTHFKLFGGLHDFYNYLINVYETWDCAIRGPSGIYVPSGNPVRYVIYIWTLDIR